MPVEEMSLEEFRRTRPDLSKPKLNKLGVDISPQGKLDRTRNGRVYASLKEARFHDELVLRRKAGNVSNFHEQVSIPLTVNGTKISTYVADFLIFHADGTQELVDTKGYCTPLATLKINLYHALNLHPPLRLA